MIIYVAEQNHTQILVVQQLAVDKCIGILHKAYTKTLNGILQTKKNTSCVSCDSPFTTKFTQM